MVFFNNINLKSLYCFVTVVEAGGFSQAQNILHMSPGSVSNHIMQLEYKLGYRLCERGPKGFFLTEKGEVFYKNALLLLQQTNDFWDANQDLQHRLQGTIYMGCMDMTYTDENSKIETILHTIHTQNPDIKFHVEYMNSTHLENAILMENLHIALCSSPNKHHLLDYICLYREQCYLYVGKNHALFDVDDSQITHKVLSQQSFSRRAFHIKHLPDTDGVFESSNAEAHLVYIKSGLALGILPQHIAKPYCQSGILRPIRPDVIHHAWDVNLVFKRTKQKKRLLKYVINTICNIYNISSPF